MRRVVSTMRRSPNRRRAVQLELVQLKGNAPTPTARWSRSGRRADDVYDNVRRNDEVAWGDCAAAPRPTPAISPSAFALTRVSAAYLARRPGQPQLQPLCTAWATQGRLQAYKTRLEEAAKRDHRKLGAELDLYSFPETSGRAAVFHPKGGVIKREMEDYVAAAHIEEGFLYVGTPHTPRSDLFYTSDTCPITPTGCSRRSMTPASSIASKR